MRISLRVPSHISPATRAPVRRPLSVRYAPQPERFEGSPEQEFGPPLQRLKGREGLSLCGYAYQVSVGTLWQLDHGPPHNEFDIAVPMPLRPHYALADMPNLHLLVPTITYSRRLKLHFALTVLSALGFFGGFWWGAGLLLGNFIVGLVRLTPFFMDMAGYAHNPGFKHGNALDVAYGAALLDERVRLVEQMIDDGRYMPGNPHATVVHGFIGDARRLVEEAAQEVEAKITVGIYNLGGAPCGILHTSKTALFLPQGNERLHDLRTKIGAALHNSYPWIAGLPVKYMAAAIGRVFMPVKY